MQNNIKQVIVRQQQQHLKNRSSKKRNKENQNKKKQTQNKNKMNYYVTEADVMCEKKNS